MSVVATTVKSQEPIYSQSLNQHEIYKSISHTRIRNLLKRYSKLVESQAQSTRLFRVLIKRARQAVRNYKPSARGEAR